ncbi:MAG: hypothetical protein AB7N80_03265 [Bdellovibrionales bacterium]
MKTAQGAAFFALASVAAGVLHYLFQLWAATRLSSLEFGELTSWIAYYSIALSLGAFAQYAANFFSTRPRTLKILSWGAVSVGLLSLGGPFYLPHADGFAVALIGVFLGVIFSWFTGQAQSKLAFVVMGLGTLLTGIAKFVLAGANFPVDNPSIEMAWAVALSYAPGLVWMAATMVLFANRWTLIREKRRRLARGLGATALLSFASVYIPQMDVVAIHRTQTPEIIGEFAKIALLYKAVFFGFLIFAQWLLPHQISEHTSSYTLVRWISVNRWRVLIASAVIGLAAFVASLTIGTRLNPALKDQLLWIFLSCVNMVFLTNLFFCVQVACVREKLLRPALICLALITELILSMILKLPVTDYLTLAIIFNGMVWLVLTHEPEPRKAVA